MAVSRKARRTLTRVVAVVNQKGGVLKSSIAGNVGGQVAAAGGRVLLIDLDARAAGLRTLMGMSGREDLDQGESIIAAAAHGSDLLVVGTGREGLDFVPGGEVLGDLALLADRAEDGMDAAALARGFAEAVARVAGEYDLVVIDCAPQDVVLQDLALAAASWVLISARGDLDSLLGVPGVVGRVDLARTTNPALRYLGVVFAGLEVTATRVAREMTEMLEALEVPVPILTARIRHSTAVAWDTSVHGGLAHELAQRSQQESAGVLTWLRRRRQGGGGEPAPRTISTTAIAVAEDYAALTDEILTLMTEEAK